MGTTDPQNGEHGPLGTMEGLQTPDTLSGRTTRDPRRTTHPLTLIRVEWTTTDPRWTTDPLALRRVEWTTTDPGRTSEPLTLRCVEWTATDPRRTTDLRLSPLSCCAGGLWQQRAVDTEPNGDEAGAANLQPHQQVHQRLPKHRGRVRCLHLQGNQSR